MQSMTPTSIASYRKHQYSGPKKSRKRVRAQLKRKHNNETTTRTDVWRKPKVKKETLYIDVSGNAENAWLNCQSEDHKVFQKCQIKYKEVQLDVKEENSEIDQNKLAAPDIVPNEWVIEKQLCRCCHVDGDNFLSLEQKDPQEGVSYEDMLATCSGIRLLCVEESALRALCGPCAARLSDAHILYKKLRASEARFHSLYNNNLIRVAGVTGVHIEIKVEPTDANDEELADGISTNENLSDSLLEEEPKQKVPNTQNKSSAEMQINSSKSKETLKKQSKSKKDAPHTVHYEYCKKIDNGYKCAQCEAQYSTQSYTKRHYDKVHLNLPPKIRCYHCRKTFNTTDELATHKQEENVAENYKCNACDKYFNHPYQLRRHIQSYHMLGERVVCTVCDYECYSKISLRKHMDKHKEVKDYQCKFCNKSFLRHRTLVLHERIHTGDKRKKCGECGQAFVQKASLNYHMTKNHPGVKF